MTRSLDAAVRCSGCEQLNGPLAHFCRHCGARLGTPAESGHSAAETTHSSASGSISRWGLLFSRLGAARRAPATIAAAAVAMTATLALVGWQVHWPAALFAAEQSPAAQAGAAAGARSSPGLTTRPPSGPTAAASSPGHAVSTPATSAGRPAVPQVSSPAATVRAYFAAINSRNYAKAWRLGGRNTGVSEAAFMAGFAGTARDVLTVLSRAGPVVTARLTAHQSDGTRKIFEGTYTVKDGVITQFEVRQVG